MLTKTRTIGVVLALMALSAARSAPAVLAQGKGDPHREADTRRFDRHGDPLPEAALLRIGTTRLQHAGEVRALAVSDDGRILASFGSDRAVRVWDAKDGRPMGRFELPTWGPWAPAFSRDGKELIAVSYLPDAMENGGFRHWDLATGRVLSSHDVPATSQYIYHVALARRSNGAFVAAGTAEHDIFLYTPGIADSGKMLKGHTGRVMSLCFTNDAKELVSLGDEGMVRFWNTGNGQEIARWPIPPIKDRSLKGNTAHLAVSADGATVAASLPDDSTRILDRAGRELRRYSSSERTNALIFSSNGKTLITGGRTIEYWNADTGEAIDIAGETRDPIRALSLSPDGELAAFADERDRLRVVALATGKILFDRKLRGQGGVAFSPDGRFLAVAPGDDTIGLWDAATLRIPKMADVAQPAVVLQCGGKIGAFQFAPDGQRLATVENGSVCRIYDVASSKAVVTIHAANSGLFSVVFSADGTRLVTIGERNHPQTFADLDRKLLPSIRLWDTHKGKELAIGRTLRPLPHTVVYHPHGKSVAVIHLPPRSEEPFFSGAVAFPDSRQLSADDRLETIRLWDLDFDREKRRFDDPAQRAIAEQWMGCVIGRPRSVAAAFSPDGRLFAAHGPGDIVLFETATGRPRQRLRGHLQGEPTGLAFTPDGRTLASVSTDSTLVLWDVTGLRTGKKLSASSDELWALLSDDDAEKAGRAIGTLVHAPVESVTLFRKHLKPIATSKDRLRKLVADLDHSQFAVRDKALQELAALGPIAETTLTQALRDNPSLEASRRMQTLLAGIQSGRPQPDQLRAIRAVEVLERIGSRPARDFLQELAAGADGAPLTDHAREALSR